MCTDGAGFLEEKPTERDILINIEKLLTDMKFMLEKWRKEDTSENTAELRRKKYF